MIFSSFAKKGDFFSLYILYEKKSIFFLKIALLARSIKEFFPSHTVAIFDPYD